MKVVICGGGHLGIEAYMSFHAIGANVTIVDQFKIGGLAAKYAQLIPHVVIGKTWKELTSALGRETIRSFNYQENDYPTYFELWHEYLGPIVKKLSISESYQKGKVQRIQKRFITTKRNVSPDQRFKDLFRVVYQIDPSQEIEEDKKDNPDTYKNLDKNIVQSLAQKYEAFTDCDLAVDAFGNFANPLPMGAGGNFALNEALLPDTSEIYYGSECFEHLEQLQEKAKHITIVGAHPMAVVSVLALANWSFKSKENKLLILSEEKQLFGGVRNSDGAYTQSLAKEFESVSIKVKGQLSKDIDEFEHEIKSWKALTPQQQAKTQRPTEPEPQIHRLNGYHITAVDHLVDKEGLFITCERDPFLDGQPNHSLLTRQTDAILVFQGFRSQRQYIQSTLMQNYPIDSAEPGLYVVQAVEEVKKITDNALCFFTQK